MQQNSYQSLFAVQNRSAGIYHPVVNCLNDLFKFVKLIPIQCYFGSKFICSIFIYIPNSII